MNFSKTSISVYVSLVLTSSLVGAEPIAYNQSQLVTDDVAASFVKDQADLSAGDPLQSLNVTGDGVEVSLVGSSVSAVTKLTDSQKTPISGWYTFAGISASAQKGSSKGVVLELGGADTDTVNINVDISGAGKYSDTFFPGHMAVGLGAYNNAGVSAKGGQINVAGESLIVTVSAHGESAPAYGIHAQNNTTAALEENCSKIVIDADQTIVNVTSDNGSASGLVAMSQGIIVVNGSLEINAKDAIVARGGAQILINPEGDESVVNKLNGDLNFNYDKATSGTSVDATVEINLTNASSYWNGSAIYSWDTGSENPPSEVTGLTLGLSNGAQWTPNFVEATADADAGEYQIAINTLSFNDGVININDGAKQKVLVDTLTGSGGTVNVKLTVDGQTASGGCLSVGRVDESLADTPALNVVAAGITADDVSSSNEDAVLAALSRAVVGSESGKAVAVTRTNIVQEGDIKGTITQTVDEAGQVGNVVQYANTKLVAYGTLMSLGTFLWRHEMDDLTERMGELRDSPEGVGSWVRLYGSEQEYQSLTVKNTTVQVGTDIDVGSRWKVGAAFSYTDGNSDEDSGEGDADMYGFAVYGTWFAENGLFIDLIGKYTRMSTDFNTGNMASSYDNNALSASVEAGWHLPIQNFAFIEPQAAFTYGRILGDDFTASNGVAVEQNDTDVLIARAGLRAGFYFPDNKGTVYARASVLHDFDGEIESRASKGNASERIYDDLGGTWCELGVGANLNLTDRTYTYVDLEKATGGEVQENWRWNIGLRYVW